MYIATYIIDIIALSFLIGLIYSSTMLNVSRKKAFFIGIILTIIIILSEIGTVLFGNESLNLRNLNIICNMFGFILAPIVPIAITLIFDKRIFTTRMLLMIPTLVNLIALILSPLFGFVFIVDINNQYIRGDYFFIFVTVYIINFLFLVVSTLNAGKTYNYPFMKKMLAISLFTITCTSIQLVDASIYSTWHCVTLSLFLYFILMCEFDSSFDLLTGLFNRTAFDKRAKGLCKKKSISVIILDIDKFKMINDQYGHDYGDIVLRIIASIIRKSFNKLYTCYRYGGDEFLVISSELDKEKIEIQLKGMTNALEKKRDEDNRMPTISYGYSISPPGKKLNLDMIIKEADAQMYHFKRKD